MKVIIPPYCDNSPKMQLIADFNQAFAEADTPKILSYLHPEITWEMVNEQTLNGHTAVRAFIEKNADLQIKSWELQQVLSHGKTGAAQGQMTLAKQVIHFAEFYEFASHASFAKIRRIKTWSISEKI